MEYIGLHGPGPNLKEQRESFYVYFRRANCFINAQKRTKERLKIKSYIFSKIHFVELDFFDIAIGSF